VKFDGDGEFVTVPAGLFHLVLALESAVDE
jgi:hypothetical protein